MTELDNTNFFSSIEEKRVIRRKEKNNLKNEQRTKDKFKNFAEDVFNEKSKRENLLEAQRLQNEKYAQDFIEDIISTKPKTKKKVNKMNQFLTLDIGSNKATIDLSKVRKQGLVFEKTMFGKKPKIVIYYQDRPETPEVNFELNSEEEARSVYESIKNKLNSWAQEANSARLQILEQELELMKQQKEALIEETKVLKEVFNQFKEMMQIMEDDTKTSSLVDTIKAM